MLFWIRIFHHFIKLQVWIMTTNLDIVNAAVSLIIKVALLAARFSGRARKPKKVEDEVARWVPAWYPNHVFLITPNI